MRTDDRGHRHPIRFDRNELAGAFGDIGTDLPLIAGIALAAGLDVASVLILFGILQIATALHYRLPMPVQPLKAMAALVIAQKIAGPILFGAGLAIGVVMLLLSATGSVDRLARLVPKCVVRGIQLGLGLQLSSIALKEYMRSDGAPGLLLAFIAFVIVLLLLGNRKWPAAIVAISLGLAYAVFFKMHGFPPTGGFGFHLPLVHLPRWPDILTGFLVLALPQIPLSLGNSILATRQISEDLFPERPLHVRRIGFTYAVMNLISPFFGGVPVCHGSGGMAGHYAFGGRTGGSVVLYGLFWLSLGLFFSNGFDVILRAFPLPILGTLLLFEGMTLVLLVRDLAAARRDLAIAVLVGLIAGNLPYGYLAGLVIGTILHRLPVARGLGLGRDQVEQTACAAKT
jgi:xanthine/uracil permease